MTLARLTGWRCYHPFDSRRSARGFPDLVLLKPPWLCSAELKTDTGRVTPEQALWLDALSAVADVPETYLWRPRDWDRIVTCLQRRAGAG